MKSSSLLFLMMIVALAAACGGRGGSSTATLVSITISPSAPLVHIGASPQQLTATGRYSDNSTRNLTASVTWTSSAPGVAGISAAGLVTPVTAGTSTISAAVSSITARTTLTVMAPSALQFIIVEPEDSSIAVGATQQFTAIGIFTDNSAQDLTASVVWTSSSPAVASISNAGLVSASAAGAVTITASADGTSDTAGLTVTAAGANNVLPITVNGALCAAGSYPNKPCVSVTICAPGTTNCQTIDDILLDTGSFGLRIFKQAVSVLASPSGGLAECIEFGNGTSAWGPVQSADIILGNEPRVTVPIQVIDATFAIRSARCAQALASPAAAGYTGILGVGPFANDCGTGCASSADNRLYFMCGADCSGTTVPLESQVQNPVTLLPQDNNGVIVQFPGVPLGGTPSVDGTLILGIGTQANNAPPASVKTYTIDAATGEFSTQFGGITYRSIIDSGENGILIDTTVPPLPPATAGQLPACAAPNEGWFCPSFTTNFSATNVGASGTSGAVPFQIGNFVNLTSGSGNNAYVEIGGFFTGGFNWGMPFFYGRNVFVGFSGSSSSLGTGPYWAY